MKKQTEQEQKLTTENGELKDQIQQIHEASAPKPKRKILHLPKKNK